MNSENNLIIMEDINLLKFDPENPRIPSDINKNDEKEILDWMLNDATLIELMGSIGESGYFSAEPLLVVKDGNGAYIVVEGNRRLAAVKLLNNPELAPRKMKAVSVVVQKAKIKPSHLPIIIYSNRDKIIDYLGYRHVTGIKEWGPLAKAKYLKQLYYRYFEEEQEAIYKKLAQIIGSRADYANKLLIGLALFNEIAEEGFYDIPGLNENTLNFSLITTATSYNKITAFLGLSFDDLDLTNVNKNHLRELTKWLFERVDSAPARVAESRNLNELSYVVANEKALTAFRQGTPLAQAVLYTEEPDESFHNKVLNAKSEIVYAREISHLLKKTYPYESDVDTLDEIKNISQQLGKHVKDILRSEEGD